MKQKIKDLFRKTYNKLFRKKTSGEIFRYDNHGDTSVLPPEWFRRHFEAVYPNGAKLLESISIKETGRTEIFFINGEVAAKNLHVLKSDDIPAPKPDEE